MSITKIGEGNNLRYLNQNKGWDCTRKNSEMLKNVFTQKPNGAADLNYSLIRTKRQGTTSKLYIPGLRINRAGKIEQNIGQDAFTLGYYNSRIDPKYNTFLVDEAKTLRQFHFVDDTKGPLKKGADILQDSIGNNSQETMEKLADTLNGFENLDYLMILKMLFDATYAGCNKICFTSISTCPIITQDRGKIIKSLIQKKIIKGMQKIGDGFIFELNTPAISNFLAKMENTEPKQNPIFAAINKNIIHPPRKRGITTNNEGISAAA